jgi:hypothetical protein
VQFPVFVQQAGVFLEVQWFISYPVRILNCPGQKKLQCKHSPRRSRSRLPRWLRPHSSGNLSDPTTMSEGQESRAERIARYKEQRRRELAAQFNTHSDPPASHRRNSKDTNSSGSEGPRPTRTSRLRAAATTAQENCSSPPAAKLNSTEVKRPSSF